MTDEAVSLLFAVSSSAWVYARLMMRTGQNRQASVIATFFFGLLMFVLMWTLLSLFPESGSDAPF